MSRILVLDSVGGASGDMFLGLFCGLGIDLAEMETFLHTVLPDEFHLACVPGVSCGVSGLRCLVHIPHEHRHEHVHERDHEHHHHGRTWRDIRQMLDASDMPREVKIWSKCVFAMLAEAEAGIHGVPVDEVHFHEIGAVDSIVDIVGSCYAFVKLNITGIVPGVIPTGSGTFHCAHGTYPLPAPATLAMLKVGNLEHCDGGESTEMLTPTGAALLAAWPKLAKPHAAKLVNTSYSLGQKEYATRPNLLRGRLYETDDADTVSPETLWQLESNLDDATPEMLSAAAETLMEAGALDVWQEAIVMKKGRLAVKLCTLCDKACKNTLQELYFRHTTTFGVRAFPVERTKLDVSFRTVETEYGTIRIKDGFYNGKLLRSTPEYEDCRKPDAPFPDVYRAAYQSDQQDA